MESSSRDTVVVTRPTSGRHRHSIFDAIATIEQYSLCEKEAGNLPEETVTRVTLVHFLEVGARHGFFTSLPLLLTAPLGFAVIKRVIPIFGKSGYSFTDNVFVIMLSGLPALATIIFIGIMFSILFHGNVSRKCMNMLSQGLLIGKFVSHFLVFVALHGVYYFVIKNPVTYKYIFQLKSFINLDSRILQKLAIFVHNLGEPIIQAAWYTVALFVAALLVITSGYHWGGYKSRKLVKFQQKWLLR